MAIKSSGTLAMTEIVAEFGGAIPHALNEYYRDGGLVPANNTGVPTSGTIAIGNFYGAVTKYKFQLIATQLIFNSVQLLVQIGKLLYLKDLSLIAVSL